MAQASHSAFVRNMAKNKIEKAASEDKVSSEFMEANKGKLMG